jgi:hypothetical protein
VHERAEVDPAELASERQRVVPVRLQATDVHIGRSVERAVVGRRAVDVCGVEPGEPPGVEDRGEVGVVAEQAVDLDGDAGGDRMRGDPAVDRDHAAVAVGGLEHHGRAAAAARLQVEHHGRVLGQRVLVDERLGPAQAGLLGVGEDEDDVVA